MVNYLYDHDSIEDNHEHFVRGGTIVRSQMWIRCLRIRSCRTVLLETT